MSEKSGNVSPGHQSAEQVSRDGLWERGNEELWLHQTALIEQLVT